MFGGMVEQLTHGYRGMVVSDWVGYSAARRRFRRRGRSSGVGAAGLPIGFADGEDDQVARFDRAGDDQLPFRRPAAVRRGRARLTDQHG